MESFSGSGESRTEVRPAVKGVGPAVTEWSVLKIRKKKMGGGYSKTVEADRLEKYVSESTNNGVVDSSSFNLINVHVSVFTLLTLGVLVTGICIGVCLIIKFRMCRGF